MDQYEKIAGVYEEALQHHILRKESYLFTLREILGDISNREILEAACGSGGVSRMLIDAGASKVIGFDKSKAMIDQAKKMNVPYFGKIEYFVASGEKVPFYGQVNLAVACMFLHYAESRAQLESFCKSISKHLLPGCRFVAVNHDPVHPIRTSKKYNVTITSSVPDPKDGDEMVVTFYSEGKKIFSFNHYYWSKETYEDALKKAGFKEVNWHAMRISPEGLCKYPPSFWEDYLASPGAVVIEAKK